MPPPWAVGHNERDPKGFGVPTSRIWQQRAKQPTGSTRPLCASIDYVHENVGDPANKLRTRFMLHIILAVAVVKLSLPARPNCLLPGLQGQRSEGDLEMHLS